MRTIILAAHPDLPHGMGPALRTVALLVLAATAAVVAGYGKGAHPSRTAAVSVRTKEPVS